MKVEHEHATYLFRRQRATIVIIVLKLHIWFVLLFVLG